MSRPVPVVLALTLLSAVLLAGCASPASDVDGASADTDPTVVTSPDDYSYAENASLGDRPHLHDYWGGKERLEIMSTTESHGTFVFTDRTQMRFRPPPGAVVPQGTEYVEVTFTWTEGATDVHAQPELYVTTAADNEAVPVAPLEQGVPVRVPSTNAKNDLPHQTLSAWIFDWSITPRDASHFMWYQGEITIHVVAVRGIEIPLYPGHPDRWENATELPLLETVTGTFVSHGDAVDGQMCFFGCLERHRPADGAVVPQDADFVEVVLTQDPAEAPGRLGLKYHGADTREFALAEPEEESEGTRLYRIPVTRGMGDGPYAEQSLWEFTPVVETLEGEAPFAGSYTLTARAVRDA